MQRLARFIDLVFTKRKAHQPTKRTISCHDDGIWDAISLEAKRNKTDMSSIIANFLEYTIQHLDGDKQKSLSEFESEISAPKFFCGDEKQTIDIWYQWAKTLTPKDLERFSDQLDIINRVRGVLLDERRYR